MLCRTGLQKEEMLPNTGGSEYQPSADARMHMHAGIYSIPGIAGITIILIVASSTTTTQVQASGRSSGMAVWGPFFLGGKKQTPALRDVGVGDFVWWRHSALFYW